MLLMQLLLTILIVAACVLWLGYFAYRFFRTKSACGGSCCDRSRPASQPSAGQTVFFARDDLVRRIHARK